MNIFKPACILPLALLTACAPPPPPDTAAANIPTDSSQNVTVGNKPGQMPEGKAAGNAASINSWSLSGAMAAKGNGKAWSASVNWQQNGAGSYNIRLFGPLGSGTVIVEKHGSVVNYKDGPKTITSRSAEDLLQKQTGIRLPLNSFYYWVRGIPAPGGVQGENRDASRHLVSLRQGGYTINYNGYTRVGNVDLPNRINLQGNGVSVKLVINHWNV